MPSTEPLFEIQGLSKTYPGVIANDKVSFNISQGSIHALLGENGAGKSTLVKMIYGLVEPTSGSMRFGSAPFAPARPQIARAAGIGMVFQHFSLFDAMSVAENIAVGMDEAPDSATLNSEITRVSAEYGLPLDPAQIIGNLSVGERQRVEIVRCLLQNPKLLIMDEPTSVLTPGEVDQLFSTLRLLRDQGVSILYISHKLEEIRALCDHATVLRRGKVVGEAIPAEHSARELAELMVGETLAEPTMRQTSVGEVILSIQNANLPPKSTFGTDLRDVTLSLRKGQIIGVAGVAGNGQDELLSILSGEAIPSSGSIELDGNDITHMGPNARRALGLLTAPEERLGHAAIPDMSLTQNTVLTAQTRGQLANGSWISWQKTRDFADAVIEKFDVRTPGNHVSAGALSGGNLQKFVVGREIMQDPRVLVVNQPTWGVDAAAAGFIRQALRDLADEGAGVIVISQDLDEIFELADDVAVLFHGRLSPVHEMKSMDISSVGILMGGEF